jgi:predicted DNA-binding transcriptional regulator YafY
MQCSRADRQREILHFVTHERERDDEGFIKVPVARFAGSLGVDRKTIGRDIGELERAGFIETRVLQPSLRNRERWARVTDRPF